MNMLRPLPPNWTDNESLPNSIPLPPLVADPNNPNGHNDPPPRYILQQAPRGMEWVKQFQFSSEFNARNGRMVPMRQLNRWTTDNHWQGRFPAVFDANNVTYNGTSMVLRVRQHNRPTDVFLRAFGNNRRRAINERMRAGQRFYTGSFVRSVETLTYGYFESVVRMGDSGLSSAFWLKEVGGREREIDVFEYSTSRNLDDRRRIPLANQFLMNVHSFERRGNRRIDHERSKFVNVDADLSKQRFVKVGLLWTRNKVCWYLNDTLVRELNNVREFHNARMRVQFDREYFNWIGDPSADDRYGDFEEEEFNAEDARKHEKDQRPNDESTPTLKTGVYEKVRDFFWQAVF